MATPDGDAWQVVVIGAGPAGSVCAYELARQGHRVLLVERSNMPRSKVCGCCLAAAGAAELHRAGLASVLSGATRIESCSLHAGGRTATLPARGFHVISREDLDSRLVAAAQNAGADVVTGRIARVRPDGGVELTRAAGLSGGHDGPGMMQAASDLPRSVNVLFPGAIVVADGLGGGSLAGRDEFSWRVSPRSRIGIGTTLSRSPLGLRAAEIKMVCGQSGYLGMVRLPGGTVDVAASLDPDAVREARGPAKLCADMILAAGGDARALDGAAWKGTPLLTRRRERVEAGNVYVIGDAAGYVEPFTGEGMTWAIRGARLAAQVIDRRLHGQGLAGDWGRVHRREIGWHQRRCAITSTLIRRPWVLRAAAAVGGWAPPVLDRLAQLLGPGPRLCERGGP